MTKSISRRTVLSLAAAAPFALSGVRSASAASHAGATHHVEIKGFGFHPASIEVKAGDTIMFTNNDSAPHTATADSGAFDTGRLKRGESAKVVISEAGTHSYFCALHRSMKGAIVAS